MMMPTNSQQGNVPIRAFRVRRAAAASKRSAYGNISYPSLQRMSSMSDLDVLEESEHDKKLDDFFQKIGDSIASFRLAFYHKVNHPIKEALFRFPTPGKKNKLNNRMRPKLFVSFIGFALISLSAICLAYAIAKATPSGACVSDYIPWLSFLDAIPAVVWIFTALLGTWMMSSTPHPNREHGVFRGLPARPERRFGDSGFCSRYDKLSESASRIFDVRDSFIGEGTWSYGIWEGIDDVVEAMSFGYIPIKEFSVAQEGTPCYDLKGSRKEEREICAKYDDAIEKFGGIMDIWSSQVGLSLRHATFYLTSFRDYDRTEKLAEIAALGKQLGVEEAVDAYMSGVPLEDVMA